MPQSKKSEYYQDLLWEVQNFYINRDMTASAYEKLLQVSQRLQEQDNEIEQLRRRLEYLESITDTRGHDDNDNLD